MSTLGAETDVRRRRRAAQVAGLLLGASAMVSVAVALVALFVIPSHPESEPRPPSAAVVKASELIPSVPRFVSEPAPVWVVVQEDLQFTAFPGQLCFERLGCTPIRWISEGPYSRYQGGAPDVSGYFYEPRWGTAWDIRGVGFFGPRQPWMFEYRTSVEDGLVTVDFAACEGCPDGLGPNSYQVLR
jgi:hypothetical protein